MDITYKGKDYPTRTFLVHHPELPEGGTIAYTIGTRSLEKVLLVEDASPIDEEAESIDEAIYFYIEDSAMTLSAKEIVEKHLDISMTLKEEL